MAEITDITNVTVLPTAASSAVKQPQRHVQAGLSRGLPRLNPHETDMKRRFYSACLVEMAQNDPALMIAAALLSALAPSGQDSVMGFIDSVAQRVDQPDCYRTVALLRYALTFAPDPSPRRGA